MLYSFYWVETYSLKIEMGEKEETYRQTKP